MDGPDTGSPPEAWDICVEPSQYFMAGDKQVVMPHTTVVKVGYSDTANKILIFNRIKEESFFFFCGSVGCHRCSKES